MSRPVDAGPPRFSIAGDYCWAVVDAVSTEDTKRDFWKAAVPQLGRAIASPPPSPCIVVCRVAVPPGRVPAGPGGRAKGLLDALHDDRKSGPWYRDLAHQGVPADDRPDHVRGLAVEVAVGATKTEYLLGSELAIRGERLASIPVDAAAPNDIALHQTRA